MTVLTTAEWQARAEAHRERALQWTAPWRERRSRGAVHPVYDFLFQYYHYAPAKLEAWHPSADEALAECSLVVTATSAQQIAMRARPTDDAFVCAVGAFSERMVEWAPEVCLHLAQHGRISYRAVLREGLAREGRAAFFTLPKWSSRVLMNAPAQGTLPWFYNEVLPLAEAPLLRAVKVLLYDTFLAGPGRRPPLAPEEEPPVPLRLSALQRHRSRIGTLPTANPDFLDDDEEEGDDDDLGETYGYVDIPKPPAGLEPTDATPKGR